MENNLDSNVPEKFRDVFVGKSTASEQNPNLAGSKDNAGVAESEKKQGEEDMENKTPELKDVVREEVQSYFAEKDAQEKVEARITGLETDKAELVKQIEQLTASNKALTDEVTGLKAEKETLEGEKKILASEKEAAETRASEATAELEGIKKEQVTATRKAELETDGVLLADEAMQAKQIAKISEMNEEQFADYKAELVALAAKSEKGKKPEDGKDKKDDKAKAETEKSTASAHEPGDAASNFAQALASAQNPTCDASKVELYTQL